MVDQNMKSHLIGIKFGSRGSSGSLITNPSSTFRNLEWPIEYGETKSKTITWFGRNSALRDFSTCWSRIWSKILNFQINFSKLQWQFPENSYSNRKHWKLLDPKNSQILFQSSNFLYFGPPYCIWHFEFWNVELGFCNGRFDFRTLSSASHLSLSFVMSRWAPIDFLLTAGVKELAKTHNAKILIIKR